jgi:hypothetical protein
MESLLLSFIVDYTIFTQIGSYLMLAESISELFSKAFKWRKCWLSKSLNFYFLN